MEVDAVLAADRADLLQRLHHADLVVDAHHGDQTGLVCDRILQIVQIDQSVLLHGEVRHLEAALRQPAAAVQDALVLLEVVKGKNGATVWVVMMWFFFSL